jgi:hypothetical protein
MSTAAEDHVFARLDMNVTERARARELDDDDLKVLQAIERNSGTRAQDVATAAAISLDGANIALSKLLRLRVVRLQQSQWQVREEVQ